MNGNGCDGSIGGIVDYLCVLNPKGKNQKEPMNLALNDHAIQSTRRTPYNGWPTWNLFYA